MDHVPMIVVTGGPCAGKTTALAKICEMCRERGFHPLIAPEAATSLIGSGLDPRTPEFQEYVLRDIIHSEKLRLDVARSGIYKKPVIICDRGRMDGRAYVDEDVFNAALKKAGIGIIEARDIYDGIIFLQSAANGAGEFYTLENNAARYESLEEAKALDDRTKSVWNGSPHLIPIDNKPNLSFDEKIAKAVKSVARVLGVPEPVEAEHKFLLGTFDPSSMPADAVKIDIVQTYLVNSEPNVVERVRARGQDNQWFYYHTTKEPRGPGVVIEHDRLIDAEEYQSLLVRRDLGSHRIHKTRWCFTYNEHYCELDVFLGKREGLVLLEIEVHSMDDPVEVPPFLGPYTEVTGDPNYSNAALARAA